MGTMTASALATGGGSCNKLYEDRNHTKIIGNNLVTSMEGGCLFFSRLSGNKTRNNLVEPKKEETDALLAQTLNQLSMEERNEVLHDLHGVADMPEETPDFVSQLLKELKVELSLIPNSEKEAFEMAESVSNSFVHDPLFQLGFVRAELYKVKLAAQRMVSYFEQKLRLFGKDTLTRPIRLSDLHPEDLKFYRKGFFQLFPERDQTGRVIMCQKIAKLDRVPVEIRCRLTWYVYSVAAEDEQVQRKGAIFVSDAIGFKRFFSSFTGRIPELVKLSQCLPIRLSALHVCYDDPVVHPIIKPAVFVLNRNQKCRLRFHYGSRMECHYALMTFGIPKHVLPADEDLAECLTHAEEFLKQRKAIEESVTIPTVPNSEEQQTAVVVPMDMDVLLGRGKARLQTNHPGNLRYQKLLRDHYHAYECAPEKMLVIEVVLQKIKNCNGRFLRKDNKTGWAEIDDVHARQKIGHAFRNLRAPPKQGGVPRESPSFASNRPLHINASYIGRDSNKKACAISSQFVDKIMNTPSMPISTQIRGMEEELLSLRSAFCMSSKSQCA